MLKPVKKKRRKALPDPNQWAHRIVQASTEERPADTVPDFRAQLSAYMSKLGKKGGKISGATRKERIPEARRIEIASAAALAMWAKRRAKEKKA